MTDDKSPPKSEFTEKEVPTKPGNPKPFKDDGYDTSFLKDDSTFSQAVRIVAAAARAIEAEREEHRSRELAEQETKRFLHEQQNAILLAIQNADRNNTANYQMLALEMKLLKQSDVSQDSEIAQLKKLPATIEERIAALRDEILTKLPGIVQDALKPYADRLEALESEAAQARSDPSSD